MKKLTHYFKKEQAFTLIEMAIVLFVISVLLLLVVPNVSKHRETAAETGEEAIVTVVDTQKELYYMEKGSEPSIQELVSEGYITQEQADQYNGG